jgi:hypothetical protein
LRDLEGQEAVTKANVHLLERDASRVTSNTTFLKLAGEISKEVAENIGLQIASKLQAVSIDSQPVQVNTETARVSFNQLVGRFSQVLLSPSTGARYVLFDETERVVDSGSLSQSEQADFLDIIARPAGKYLLRLKIDGVSDPVRVAVRSSDIQYYLSNSLPSSNLGSIKVMNLDELVQIQSEGNDEAWLRILTKRGKTYTARTLGLAADIDTHLEVFDSAEKTVIAENDDSGAGGNDVWASRLSFHSPDGAAYHIRIRNIQPTKGSFFLEVREDD